MPLTPEQIDVLESVMAPFLEELLKISSTQLTQPTPAESGPVEFVAYLVGKKITPNPISEKDAVAILNVIGKCDESPPDGGLTVDLQQIKSMLRELKWNSVRKEMQTVWSDEDEATKKALRDRFEAATVNQCDIPGTRKADLMSKDGMDEEAFFGFLNALRLVERLQISADIPWHPDEVAELIEDNGPMNSFEDLWESLHPTAPNAGNQAIAGVEPKVFTEVMEDMTALTNLQRLSGNTITGAMNVVFNLREHIGVCGLEHLFSELGLSGGKAQIEELVTALDADGDGTVDREELVFEFDATRFEKVRTEILENYPSSRISQAMLQSAFNTAANPPREPDEAKKLNAQDVQKGLESIASGQTLEIPVLSVEEVARMLSEISHGSGLEFEDLWAWLYGIEPEAAATNSPSEPAQSGTVCRTGSGTSTTGAQGPERIHAVQFCVKSCSDDCCQKADDFVENLCKIVKMLGGECVAAEIRIEIFPGLGRNCWPDKYGARRLQSGNSDGTIIQATLPQGTPMPSGICDLMQNSDSSYQFRDCRQGTLQDGAFTVTTTSDEDSDMSLGQTVLLLLGTVAGTCCVAYAVYLLFRLLWKGKRQCTPPRVYYGGGHPLVRQGEARNPDGAPCARQRV